MLAGGIEAFAGANVLLLQGPVGPFFARFQRDLEAAGARVTKINFNLGDCLFHPGGVRYRGTMAQWPAWLEQRLRALAIDVVFLFGDCRPIHEAAHRVATRLGIEVGVFEEGYLRPDFITLERHGVNGNSPMIRRDPDALRALPQRAIAVRPMPRSFWPMVLWGFAYFAAGAFGRPLFPHYRHHRPMTFAEAIPWLRSPLRKAWYQWAERGLAARMAGEWSGRFFLAPLQVHNDAQVHQHADVRGVPGFIVMTIIAFAHAAPADALLVFKHHPMDRGYRDYARLIARAAQEAGCADRVIYCHDQHMPSILPHCRGVITINSTAGLAAIGLGRPTIVLGEAIFDLPGLTHQGPIERFFRDPPAATPDPVLYDRFRAELIVETQINGNFYRRLDPAASATGLIWNLANRAVPPRQSAQVVPFPQRAAAVPPADERQRAHP